MSDYEGGSFNNLDKSGSLSDRTMDNGDLIEDIDIGNQRTDEQPGVDGMNETMNQHDSSIRPLMKEIDEFELMPN